MINKIKKLFQEKLIRDAFALYLGRGLNISLGVISTIIYGAIFLKSQIALISLFEMVVELFISFGFTWSTTGLVRFGRSQFEKNRDLSFVSSIRLHIIAPILLASIIFILVFQNNILNFIGSEDQKLIIFILLNILLLVFHEHINSLFNVAEKHIANVVFHVAHSIGKLFILLLFIQNVISLDPLTYIYLNVFVLILLIVVRIPFLERSFIYPIVRVNKESLVQFFKFVAPQIYGFAGMYLINWMDLYFLRQYCSYDELGAYQFLYSIFLKLTSFAFLLNIIFFPRIMSWKESNQEALNKYIQRIPIIITLSTLAGVVLFLFIYQPLFAIFFKDKYELAYPAFNILLVSIPFFFVSFLFIPVLNSYDRVSFIQIVNIISALGNLMIDYFLIKKYGLIAGALGTHIAYVVQFQLLLFGTRKIFSMETKFIHLINLLITSVVLYYFLHNAKLV